MFTGIDGQYFNELKLQYQIIFCILAILSFYFIFLYLIHYETNHLFFTNIHAPNEFIIPG